MIHSCVHRTNGIVQSLKTGLRGVKIVLLTWQRCVQVQCINKCQLFPLLSRDSHLATSTKLLLYTTAIRSIVTYAAPVWCSISQSTYNQLQVLQNKCLRIIANAPRYTPITDLHSALGIEYIRTYMLQISARFYTKCETHDNPLVATIGQYNLTDLMNMYTRYSHKRPKHALL